VKGTKAARNFTQRPEILDEGESDGERSQSPSISANGSKTKDRYISKGRVVRHRLASKNRSEETVFETEGGGEEKWGNCQSEENEGKERHDGVQQVYSMKRARKVKTNIHDPNKKEEIPV